MANTFDPSRKRSDITLSNGNLTMATSTFGSAGTTAPFLGSGKFYFEVTATDTGTGTSIGLCDSSFSNYDAVPGNSATGTTALALDRLGTLRYNNTFLFNSAVAAYGDGDVISVLYNADDNEISYWINGTPVIENVAIPENNWQPVVYTQENPTGVTINFGDSAYAYTMPVGYSSWTDPNAPQQITEAATATDEPTATQETDAEVSETAAATDSNAYGSTYDDDVAETATAAADSDAVYSYNVAVSEAASALDAFDGRYYLHHSVSFAYDMVLRVSAVCDILWLTRVVFAPELPYAILQPISKSAEVVYDLLERTPLQKAVELPYVVRLQAAVELPYAIRPLVKGGFSVPYNLNSGVAKAVELPYRIPDKDRLAKTFTGIWSLVQSSVVNITDQPTITHNGRTVRILEGDISASEGGYAWEGNFTLADVRDYVQFNRDDAFTVNLYGEVWTFIVDGKELSRNGPAQVSCRIIGVSPSAQYVSPRAAKKDYEWDTAVSAVDAATELVPDIDWNTVDWTIPAYRLAFSDAEPIEIVKRLAEACGAVVESTLAGVLAVRRLFPVSPQDYNTTAPDHVFVELLDIFSVSESYNYGEVFNRFRLMEAQATAQDQMEWVPDYSGALSGYIRVYPAPWRTNVELRHTADAAELQIGTQQVHLREEEELIEIYKGQGNTTYPVYDIVSAEWEATNLGGIVVAQDSRDLAVVGPQQNSLVRLRYRTRSLNYRATTSSGRPAQFLLESPVE